MLSSQWKMRSYERISTQSGTWRFLTDPFQPICQFFTSIPSLDLMPPQELYVVYAVTKGVLFIKWQPWFASRRVIILSPNTKVGLLTCDVLRRRFLMTFFCGKLPFQFWLGVWALRFPVAKSTSAEKGPTNSHSTPSIPLATNKAPQKSWPSPQINNLLIN